MAFPLTSLHPSTDLNMSGSPHQETLVETMWPSVPLHPPQAHTHWWSLMIAAMSQAQQPTNPPTKHLCNSHHIVQGEFKFISPLLWSPLRL